MFHADIDGRPNLALATRRPIEMEVLLDMTPSAEVFRGSYGYYNRYLGAALPMFKIRNQINIKNGSRRAAALDLVQRHIVVEQNDGKDLDWAVLRKTLSPDAGPGTVSVKNLQNKQQSACVCSAGQPDGFLYVSQAAGNRNRRRSGLCHLLSAV